MSFRTTFIIILILAGMAGTYFLLLPKPADKKAENEKLKIYQGYDLPQKDIQKVRLSFADDAYQTLTIEKLDDNEWQITTPFKAYADITKVNEMLDDFLNKQVRQTLEVTEYGQYGLENPTITIELWKNIESSPKTFLIGKKGINFSVYTKEKSEANIFIIESSALDDLAKSPTDVRDKSLIKFDPGTITEIQFQKPEEFTCKKIGYNWKMTHPISTDADTEEIKYILSELHAMQVSTFELDGQDATSSLNKYGLDTPRIQLKLTNDNETYGLAIGSAVASPSDQDNIEKGSVYVQSIHQGGIYTVTEDIVRIVNKTIFDMRDKRVLDFQRSDVIKFEIQNNMQKIVGIKLQDKTWELQGENKLIADPQAVSDLIFGIDALEEAAYVTDSAKNLALYGLETPQIRVIFTLHGEDTPAALHIGDFAKDGTVYVKANNSDKIVRVKRDLVDKIAKGVAWLRNKQIFNFSIDDPTRVTVKYKEDSQNNGYVQFTCQRLGTNWRLTQPVKENAQNAEVNALLYELIDLKADEFVAEENELSETTTGFNTIQLQITVELRTQKVYTLQIGNLDNAGRYFARLQNQPEHIFLLNDEVIPKLKTKLKWLRTTEDQ